MRRARSFLLVLLLVTAPALAGCLGADDDVDPQGAGDAPSLPDAAWAARALADGDDHDHADPDHHRNLTTPNFEILGHDPLVSDDAGTTPRGNLCGDAKPTEDGRQLAVVESRGDVAFTLVDVTDPTAPQRLGELVMRTTYIYDLAVVPDGKHVVLVTSETKTPRRMPAWDGTADAPIGSDLRWRSPCAPGGETPVARAGPVDALAPRPASLILVSIADPAEPVIVDQRPLPGLGHSVWSGTVDGRTWVLASTWAARSGTSSFGFYEVETTPVGSLLSHLSTWSIAMSRDVPMDEWRRYMGHDDGVIAPHPATGQTLAWLALWEHGLLLLDLEDPRRPELVGRWSDFDRSRGSDDDSGNIHEAIPLPGLRDGRHYTVIGPEIIGHPERTPTGIVRVLDTTDPEDIHELGAWTLPHDVEWQERLQFSTHYLDVHDDTILVSAYHAGVWAVDLAAVQPGEWTLLPSLGVLMPVREPPAPPEDPFRWAPTLEEALVLPDGTLVTFDSNSGVFTARFHRDVTVPAPTPWPLEPAHEG